MANCIACGGDTFNVYGYCSEACYAETQKFYAEQVQAGADIPCPGCKAVTEYPCECGNDFPYGDEEEEDFEGADESFSLDCDYGSGWDDCHLDRYD